jgi:hypothetical protein
MGIFKKINAGLDNHIYNAVTRDQETNGRAREEASRRKAFEDARSAHIRTPGNELTDPPAPKHEW